MWVFSNPTLFLYITEPLAAKGIAAATEPLTAKGVAAAVQWLCILKIIFIYKCKLMSRIATQQALVSFVLNASE